MSPGASACAGRERPTPNWSQSWSVMRATRCRRPTSVISQRSRSVAVDCSARGTGRHAGVRGARHRRLSAGVARAVSARAVRDLRSPVLFAAVPDPRSRFRDPAFQWNETFVMTKFNGPLRVGIGGPVGSGKTALMDLLCRSHHLRHRCRCGRQDPVQRRPRHHAVGSFGHQQDRSRTVCRRIAREDGC